MTSNDGSQPSGNANSLGISVVVIERIRLGLPLSAPELEELRQQHRFPSFSTPTRWTMQNQDSRTDYQTLAQ